MTCFLFSANLLGMGLPNSPRRPETYPIEAWRRLGELLTDRRVQIGPVYRNRLKFAEDTGLNERLVSDLERGRRTSYRETSLHAVEVAYRIRQGSIERALRGGQFEPLEPVAHVSQVRLEAPKPAHEREGSVVISAAGSTTAIPVDPDEPEPDPAEYFHPPLDEGERMIWAMNRPWQARVAAIEALRNGIQVARAANAVRRRGRRPAPEATPDIGQAASDG